MTELRRQRIQEIEGTISSVNSSDTPLGANESFTGQPEEITDYAAIFVNVAVDAPSAADGLSIQQSSDGVNWDHVDEYTIVSLGRKNFNINPNARYFRVVYTNGPGPQAYFRLQTIYKQVYSTPSSHRIKDSIFNDDDAQLTKTILAIESNDENSFNNITLQNPIPADGDSVYAKDLELSLCSLEDFTGVADCRSFFDDYQTEAITASGPGTKRLVLHFKRPVTTTEIGLGALTLPFSNVLIRFYDLASEQRYVFDDSSNDTLYTSNIYKVPPITFIRMRIEFHTDEEVGLSGVFIPKTMSTVSRFQGISEVTGLVEGITTFNGSINIADGLAHDHPLVLYAHSHTGVLSTISVETVPTDRDIQLVNATGFQTGDYVAIHSGSASGHLIFTLVNVSGNTITLNKPIGLVLPVGTQIDQAITDMAVNGSVTPQPFYIRPPSGHKWQLTRLMFSIICSGAPDDSKFGDLPELTRGICIRKVFNDGTSQCLTDWNSNGDIFLDTFNVEYTDKAGGGNNGVRGSWHIQDSAAVISVDGNLGEYLQFTVQDDLTGLVRMQIKAQGRLFGA